VGSNPPAALISKPGPIEFGSIQWRFKAKEGDGKPRRRRWKAKEGDGKPMRRWRTGLFDSSTSRIIEIYHHLYHCINLKIIIKAL
jgi:hypothetical protein